MRTVTGPNGSAAKPEVVVTNKPRSYDAAKKVIGNVEKQETGRWHNNGAANSSLPFRRRVRAVLRFRKCDVHRNTSPSILQFTTISTRNALITAEKHLSLTELPFLLSGVAFVPNKYRHLAVN